MPARTMARTLEEAGSSWMRYDVARLYDSRLREIERSDALSDPNMWSLVSECETSMLYERRGRNLTDHSLRICDLAALSLGRACTRGRGKSIHPARRAFERNRTRMSHHETRTRNTPLKIRIPKRQKGEEREHTTRGPKGNPFAEKEFCRKNQRNQRTHGIACKYAHACMIACT